MPEQNNDINSALKRLKGILLRRRWWILGGACVVSLGTIRASYWLPNHYRSEAVIFMANPRVSAQYVVPNDTTNNMEAMDAVTREIFSRARLLELADEFGLYAQQRQMGDAALSARMRNDIEVLPLSKNPERRPMSLFLIAFTANDPWTAQKVASRLTSIFVDTNRQTEQQAETGTTSFLEHQLEAAKDNLDQQEAALEAFKLRNLGHLPEQQANNAQVFTGLQFQLQATQADLARAREQRTYLLDMLSQYAPSAAGQGAGAAGSPLAGAAPGSLAAIQEDLTRLRREREDLLGRYSPQYPDVIAINQQIADQEAALEQASKAPKPGPDGGANPTAAALRMPLDPAAVQLHSQLQANTMEIQDTERQAKEIQAQLAANQQQMAQMPLREQQLELLQRNYDLAKAQYTDLLNKKTQSALATKLTTQQSSEQFRVVDPASFPLKPAGPQRQKIALGGLIAGLGVGLALAFLIEARDRSLHSESEVRGYFPVPLVVGIPALLTVRERRQHKRRLALGWALGCLVLLLMGAAQLYVFHNG